VQYISIDLKEPAPAAWEYAKNMTTNRVCKKRVRLDFVCSSTKEREDTKLKELF